MDAMQTDIVIVGAGAVGLAVTERLSRTNCNIIVVERHESFGRETSSRNSEVVHAGIYYEPGSLKARLCVEGRRLLYEFCGENDIPYRKIGKLIVGNTDEETAKAAELLDRGCENGCTELRLVNGPEAAQIEPELSCRSAVWSPETGIFDSHRYMQTLESMSRNRGVVFAYGCSAEGAECNGNGWGTVIKDTDGSMLRIESGVVINAAGLGADRFAAGAGIDIDAAGYRQDPCKGEYFRVADGYRERVNHLIYPASTDRLKGKPNDNVHLVIELDGGMKIGPNKTFGVAPEDVDVDASIGPSFAEEMRRFLPFLKDDDVRPDSAGVRAMRSGERDGFRDFIIQEESDRGLPGLVNLIGIQSPGLTSSAAIAGYVERLL